MLKLEHLAKRVKEIEKRNKRVESDKRWETSYFRRMLLTIFTYAAIGFYLQVINVPKPWRNAIVPALAFMLSTLTLPLFKKMWLRYFYKE